MKSLLFFYSSLALVAGFPRSGKQQVSGEAILIAEYPQGQPSKKIHQGLALPVYALGRLRDYPRAALRRLAELAICLALVASLVMVMLIRLVIRIPDAGGVDG